MNKKSLIEKYQYLENTHQPRAALFHDRSGFGKCSLTVALPILSAAGVEASCIPTAVLSTHTGGFEGYTFRDLTEDLPAFLAHWKELGFEFDAVYSGYLGSPEQAEILEAFVETQKPETLFFVDPVMGDFGSLYPGFDDGMVRAMRKLIGKADLILPNMTEASLLLGIPYQEPPYSEEYVNKIVRELAAVGPQFVILTGIGLEEGQTGAAVYDSAADQVDFIETEQLPGSFHGTGDVFSSLVLAGLMNGKPLTEAVRIAVDLTAEAIARTIVRKRPAREGVDFEGVLPQLIARIGHSE